MGVWVQTNQVHGTLGLVRTFAGNWPRTVLEGGPCDLTLRDRCLLGRFIDRGHATIQTRSNPKLQTRGSLLATVCRVEFSNSGPC
jgi:hypothetical protein